MFCYSVHYPVIVHWLIKAVWFLIVAFNSCRVHGFSLFGPHRKKSHMDRLGEHGGHKRSQTVAWIASGTTLQLQPPQLEERDKVTQWTRGKGHWLIIQLLLWRCRQKIVTCLQTRVGGDIDENGATKNNEYD